MPTKKKSTKTCELMLEGKVFILEKDADGKETSREELDGEVVLKCLLATLETALSAAEETCCGNKDCCSTEAAKI